MSRPIEPIEINLRNAAAFLCLISLSFLLAIGAIRVTREEGLLRAGITSLSASIPVWFFMALNEWKRKTKANKRAPDGSRPTER